MTPTISPTATGTPTALAPPPPVHPSQLPVTGADEDKRLGWLVLGLAALALGLLILGTEYVLHNTNDDVM
jgi:hypothetical protein